MKTTELNPFTTEAERQWERERPRKILFVDDEAGLREVWARLLAGAGYEVDTAPDGHTGWGALCRKSYDLLITDHKMPGQTGLELVGKLRSTHMILPVILVSGTLDLKELHQHRWLNLAATLAKPFTAGQLLASVQDILRPPAAGTPPAAACSMLAAFSHVESWPHGGLNE
ncbi:MAG: response regulator [Verrucomicrobia bacterium]|nr:response regulator [Verrucomicrobiota bacterium]